MKHLLDYNEEDRRRIFEEYVSRDIEESKKRRQRELEAWDHLPIFKDPFDVPNIPLVSEEVYKEFYVPRLIKAGAIPKKDLIDGETYVGRHRRCSVAKWNQEKNKFEYVIGNGEHAYIDTCNHFEDDNGFALFVPIRTTTIKEELKK